MSNSLDDLARNPGMGGALAGGGMGMGMGLAVGNQMGNMFGQQMQQQPQQQILAAPPPPPLPQPVQIYAAINGQQVGPLDMNGLQQKAASGELKPDTLVWKQGLSGWTPAQQVPEVAPVFRPAGPPPLPPGTGGPPALPG
jgi:hypothetical protein